MVGATPIRPGQLIFSSTPRAQAVAAEPEHEQLAGDHDHDRPPRQQREVKRHHHPGDHQQAVDDRVQQRAEAAVLAGQPRREAVQVVRPADHREQDRRRACPGRRGWTARAPGTPGSPPGGGSRSRWGSSTGSAAGRTASPAAAGPERSSPNSRRLVIRGLIGAPAASGRRAHGSSRQSSATDCAAPSSATARDSRPAADLHLDLPGGQRPPADGQPQRAAEQLGVGELLPRSGVTLVVERLAGRPPTARGTAGRRARAPAVPGLPSTTSSTSKGAIARGQRDALLVGVLLDRRRGRPGRAEAVGAHPDQLAAPGLVQVGGAERLGVAGPELEDVADLDRRLDPDRAAVDGVAGQRRCARRRVS